MFRAKPLKKRRILRGNLLLTQNKKSSMVISKKVAITVKENMIFVFNIFMLEFQAWLKRFTVTFKDDPNILSLRSYEGELWHVYAFGKATSSVRIRNWFKPYEASEKECNDQRPATARSRKTLRVELVWIIDSTHTCREMWHIMLWWGNYKYECLTHAAVL